MGYVLVKNKTPNLSRLLRMFLDFRINIVVLQIQFDRKLKINFMESIIKRLENLYEKNLGGIREKISAYNVEHERNLDGPFLMSSREDLYRKATVKILFVGQESYRLRGRNKSESYDIIPLMENNIYVVEETHTNSPFWHSVFKITEALNPELKNKSCFFWTNVSK